MLVLVIFASLSAYSQERSRSVYNVSPAMNCQNCVNRVRQAIGALEGVDTVCPDLASQTVVVVYDGNTLKPDMIVNAMAEIGYTITPAASMLRPEARQATATAASSAQPVEAASAKMRQIENANPGIVTAIDGKPVVQSGHQCQGGACESQTAVKQTQCEQPGKQTPAKAKKQKKAAK